MTFTVTGKMRMPRRTEKGSLAPAHFPTLGQQVNNVTRAVGAATKNLLARKPFAADEETVEARRVICETCPRFAKETGRCLECGCWRQFKTWLRSESCPLKKW